MDNQTVSELEDQVDTLKNQLAARKTAEQAARDQLQALERARASEAEVLRKNLEIQRNQLRAALDENRRLRQYLEMHQDRETALVYHHLTDRLDAFVAGYREIPEIHCAQRQRLAEGFRLAMPDGSTLHTTLDEMLRDDIPPHDAPTAERIETEAA